MSGFKLLDDSSTRGAPERPGAGRWKLWLVLLVCVAPIVASYFTYYVVRPEGRRNFGELIDPMRPLPDQPSVSLSGEAGNLLALKGQWLLVSVAGGACDEACSRHLYLQRQLRETLGKDKDRLDWVWLIPDDAPVPEKLLPALSGATVLRVPMAAVSAWLAPGAGNQLTRQLYLVDPMGNWMMRFPPDLDLQSAAKVKRDLERVLRASASWDRAGREPLAAVSVKDRQ
jgi:hypothetical protein